MVSAFLSAFYIKNFEFLAGIYGSVGCLSFSAQKSQEQIF